MKKQNLVILTSLLLSACGGGTIAERTVPGTHLPGTAFTTCKGGYDAIGRCREWNVKGDLCVNPAGVHSIEPIVPCAKIKDGVYKP